MLPFDTMSQPDDNPFLPGSQLSQHGRRRNRILISGTILLFAAPLLLALIVGGVPRAYCLNAADVNYYLVVARNAVLHGGLTFDQEHSTNGFHPLWQFCTIAIVKAAIWMHLPNFDVYVLTALTSVAIISVAIVFLGGCFIHARGAVPAGFLFLPVGVYAVIGSIAGDEGRGSLYSFANGMESGLVILAWSLLLWLMTRPPFLNTVSSAIMLGMASGMLCLSRLDHSLFCVPLFIALAIRCVIHRDGKALARTCLAALIAAVMLVSYMIANLHYAGSAIPISGLAKSSFPHPIWAYAISDLVHEFGTRPVSEVLRSSSFLWRALQIAVPMLCAALFLARSLTFFRTRTFPSFEFGLSVTAVFVLVLGLYNALFVTLYNQGQWYYPVSIVFVSLACLHVFSPSTDSVRKRPGWSASKWIVTSVFMFYIALSVTSRSMNLWVFENMRDELAPLRERYEGSHAKFVAFDDGMFAYATGLPTMLGGDMLVADREAYDLRRQGESLLAIAVRRGYDHLVLHGHCLSFLQDASTPQDMLDSIKHGGWWGRNDDFGTTGSPFPFTLQLEYMSPSQMTAVLRITAAAGAGNPATPGTSRN